MHWDHLGINPTTKRVAKDYYWPSLKADVKTFGKICPPCKRVKAGQSLIQAGEFKVPDKRFSHVMVDVVGPLPDSYGHKYLLTAICRSTRFVRAIAMKEATAHEAAVAFLHGWVTLPGDQRQRGQLRRQPLERRHEQVKYRG